MKGPVSFHRLADRELNEAAQYYELERPGLGAAFLIIRCFPYGLLSTIKADGIRVLTVMNLKRRPTYRVGRK